MAIDVESIRSGLLGERSRLVAQIDAMSSALGADSESLPAPLGAHLTKAPARTGRAPLHELLERNRLTLALARLDEAIALLEASIPTAAGAQLAKRTPEAPLISEPVRPDVFRTRLKIKPGVLEAPRIEEARPLVALPVAAKEAPTGLLGWDEVSRLRLPTINRALCQRMSQIVVDAAGRSKELRAQSLARSTRRVIDAGEIGRGLARIVVSAATTALRTTSSRHQAAPLPASPTSRLPRRPPAPRDVIKSRVDSERPELPVLPLPVSKGRNSGNVPLPRAVLKPNRAAAPLADVARSGSAASRPASLAPRIPAVNAVERLDRIELAWESLAAPTPTIPSERQQALIVPRPVRSDRDVDIRPVPRSVPSEKHSRWAPKPQASPEDVHAEEAEVVITVRPSAPRCPAGAKAERGTGRASTASSPVRVRQFPYQRSIETQDGGGGLEIEIEEAAVEIVRAGDAARVDRGSPALPVLRDGPPLAEPALRRMVRFLTLGRF